LSVDGSEFTNPVRLAPTVKLLQTYTVDTLAINYYGGDFRITGTRKDQGTPGIIKLKPIEMKIESEAPRAS
jgi:hypothetical protein